MPRDGSHTIHHPNTLGKSTGTRAHTNRRARRHAHTRSAHNTASNQPTTLQPTHHPAPVQRGARASFEHMRFLWFILL